MKRLIIAALAAGLVAALAFTVWSDTGVAAKDPFTGAWQAVDIDGSNLRLSVGGGPSGVHHVKIFDDAATLACPATDGPAIAIGTGVVSGDVLHADWFLRCLKEDTSFPGSMDFLYDPSSDTLSDSFGVVYHRPGR